MDEESTKTVGTPSESTEAFIARMKMRSDTKRIMEKSKDKSDPPVKAVFMKKGGSFIRDFVYYDQELTDEASSPAISDLLKEQIFNHKQKHGDIPQYFSIATTNGHVRWSADAPRHSDIVNDTPSKKWDCRAQICYAAGTDQYSFEREDGTAQPYDGYIELYDDGTHLDELNRLANYLQRNLVEFGEMRTRIHADNTKKRYSGSLGDYSTEKFAEPTANA